MGKVYGAARIDTEPQAILSVWSDRRSRIGGAVGYSGGAFSCQVKRRLPGFKVRHARSIPFGHGIHFPARGIIILARAPLIGWVLHVARAALPAGRQDMADASGIPWLMAPARAERRMGASGACDMT